MTRCEAKPCTAEATTAALVDNETLILTCEKCRRELGCEDPLAGPREAFESWWGKP
jgi:hypothetical protein